MTVVDRIVSAMDREQILQMIKEGGIVGAGGAGFPAHIKLNCTAEVVIANGAECEPLLRTDRLLMERYAGKIVAGLKAAMKAAGASSGVIAVKKKYEKAIKALEEATKSENNISLLYMQSYYPAGDEQQIVYEVTGRIVPAGGLPLDVGAVVQNVSTLANIADSIEGLPVIEKYVTVNGEIERPAVFKVPVGTSVRALIKAAIGPEDLTDYSVIIGGPIMGYISESIDEPVTKTMGGILVFKRSHPLIQKKIRNPVDDIRLAKAVCCQCSYCTQMCPRNALGFKVEPHKVMRLLAMNAPNSMGDINGIFSCCECGICTLYACNFGLAPSRIMQLVKQELLKAGARPQKRTGLRPNSNINDIKVPVSRFITRLGIEKYDRDLPLIEGFTEPKEVMLPLKMHIGAWAEPIVKTGDSVEKGQIIGEIAEDIGANVHASIDGIVTVMEKCIRLRAVEAKGSN